MKIIRTVKTVENGQVLLNLPLEFSGQQVEIIIFTKQYSPIKKNSLKGALHNYAKPELIALESTTWENYVKDKYGDH